MHNGMTAAHTKKSGKKKKVGTGAVGSVGTHITPRIASTSMPKPHAGHEDTNAHHAKTPRQWSRAERRQPVHLQRDDGVHVQGPHDAEDGAEALQLAQRCAGVAVAGQVAQAGDNPVHAVYDIGQEECRNVQVQHGGARPGR
eukprot:scaffold1050_cov130-Isochrysis_galbana.AAC.3